MARDENKLFFVSHSNTFTKKTMLNLFICLITSWKKIGRINFAFYIIVLTSMLEYVVSINLLNLYLWNQIKDVLISSGLRKKSIICLTLAKIKSFTSPDTSKVRDMRFVGCVGRLVFVRGIFRMEGRKELKVYPMIVFIRSNRLYIWYS